MVIATLTEIVELVADTNVMHIKIIKPTFRSVCKQTNKQKTKNRQVKPNDYDKTSLEQFKLHFSDAIYIRNIHQMHVSGTPTNMPLKQQYLVCITLNSQN